jgi:CRP-like cAMP-binding protein
MLGIDESDLIRSAIFEDMSGNTVQDLCGRGHVQSFDTGSQLFERGNKADDLMILLDGVVELLFPLRILGVCREIPMESRHACDVVAWSALVAPYHFTLSARCASPCKLMSLGRAALFRFFEADPATGYVFMRNLAGVIGRRLQALQTMWMHDLEASALKRWE